MRHTGRGNPAAAIGSWLLHLATWDGVLPALVALTPLALHWMFPNIQVQRNQINIIEIASILIPIATFGLRFVVGIADLSSKKAKWQSVPFTVGLLVLAVGECAYIGLKNNPGVPAGVGLAILLSVYAIYLPLMAITFFPYKVLTRRDAGPGSQTSRRGRG